MHAAYVAVVNIMEPVYFACCRRGAYDHKIDIWGVGLIALELLTGQVANMHKDLDSVRINRHTLFDRVRECVHACTLMHVRVAGQLHAV